MSWRYIVWKEKWSCISPIGHCMKDYSECKVKTFLGRILVMVPSLLSQIMRAIEDLRISANCSVCDWKNKFIVRLNWVVGWTLDLGWMIRVVLRVRRKTDRFSSEWRNSRPRCSWMSDPKDLNQTGLMMLVRWSEFRWGLRQIGRCRRLIRKLISGRRYPNQPETPQETGRWSPSVCWGRRTGGTGCSWEVRDHDPVECWWRSNPVRTIACLWKADKLLSLTGNDRVNSNVGCSVYLNKRLPISAVTRFLTELMLVSIIPRRTESKKSVGDLTLEESRKKSDSFWVVCPPFALIKLLKKWRR